MTFRERQHRLNRLVWILAALTLVPWLMNLLDMGDFTPAGMFLYAVTFLAFGVPGLYLAVQHLRDLRRHGHERG